MKTRLMGLALFLAALVSAHAQVPALINYQGRLIDGTNLVNATASIGFYLYTNATSGSTIYIETDVGVPVVDGLYSTFLGNNPTVGQFADALTNQSLFVEVWINGSPMSPRERLASVSYAMLAGGVTNGAILPPMLGDGAVTTAKLSTNAVTAEKLAAGAVSNANLGAAAVTHDKILDGTIKAADLDDLAAWKPTGNSGLTSGTHFIGTLDNTAVDFRAFNTRVLRLQYDGSSPLITGGHSSNWVSMTGGTIGGGGNGVNPNIVTGFYATIAGGLGNRAGGARAVIGGGFGSTNNAQDGVIGGGSFNQVSGLSGTIGGGSRNTANGSMSTISGGGGNLTGPGADCATIGGGSNNTVQAAFATIHGGRQNDIGTGSVHAVIGGGWNNEIESNTLRAAIGGGQDQVIESGSYGATVAGGYMNAIRSGSLSASIGGGYQNEIRSGSSGATIAGGETNTIDVSADSAAIAGGEANTVGSGSRAAFIGGGVTNRIAGGSRESVIVGGHYNRIGTNSIYSVIGSGYGNVVGDNAWYANILGGMMNVIGTNASYSTICGGQAHLIGADGATIAGGGQVDSLIQGNQVLGSGSFVGGGAGNWIGEWSYGAVVGGGEQNRIASNSPHAAIVGGRINQIGIEANSSVLGGGTANRIYQGATNAVLVGGRINTVGTNAWYAVLGGGHSNTILSRHAFLGSGSANTIFSNSAYAVIGGGQENYVGANARNATVGGGWGNHATGIGSTIAGGGTAIDSWAYNTAAGDASFIGGGLGNDIGPSASYGVLAGGYNNTVDGLAAVVPGGIQNEAMGQTSMAAGFRAKANHDGAFVWADSTANDFASMTNDEFAIRATNGVRIAVDLGIDRALPSKGGRFADNNIVAWGFFGAQATIYNSFNIASIENTTEGSYFITLNPGLSSQAMAPVAVPEMEGPATSAASARLIAVNSSVSATSLWVYITNGSFVPTNSDFTLIVTGR